MHVKVVPPTIRNERAAAGDSRGGGYNFRRYVSEMGLVLQFGDTGQHSPSTGPVRRSDAPQPKRESARRATRAPRRSLPA